MVIWDGLISICTLELAMATPLKVGLADLNTEGVGERLVPETDPTNVAFGEGMGVIAGVGASVGAGVEVGVGTDVGVGVGVGSGVGTAVGIDVGVVVVATLV